MPDASTEAPEAYSQHLNIKESQKEPIVRTFFDEPSLSARKV